MRAQNLTQHSIAGGESVISVRTLGSCVGSTGHIAAHRGHVARALEYASSSHYDSRKC
jgi:hypothetical protein